MYRNIYDFDFKIHKSMDKCNLTMSLERLEKLNSVDEISAVLRAIFYHDTLQTWKRWYQHTNRYTKSQIEAKQTMSGPLAQMQERWIWYFTGIWPYSQKGIERHMNLEGRIGFEENIRILNQVAEWFHDGKKTIDIENANQIAEVVTEAWRHLNPDEAAKKDNKGRNRVIWKLLKEVFYDLQ